MDKDETREECVQNKYVRNKEIGIEIGLGSSNFLVKADADDLQCCTVELECTVCVLLFCVGKGPGSAHLGQR